MEYVGFKRWIASLVISVSTGSIGTIRKLTPKTAATPENAAASPARGCRPRLRNAAAPSGIKMAAAQSRARELVQAHGVDIIRPSAEELAAKRREMMAHQDQVAKLAKISPEMI